MDKKKFLKKEQPITDPLKTDPASYFNQNHIDITKHILRDAGWAMLQEDDAEVWTSPDGSFTATWEGGTFHVGPSDAVPFHAELTYTPFQILVLLQFKGDYRGAFEWVLVQYFSEDIPYIRVGTDYFKVIHKTDRFGLQRTELKIWTLDTIKLDHGKSYPSKVPHFDDFAIRPDNFNYSPVVNNCYNLYREFPHRPVPGEWPWTEILIRHIFGEQYELGIRYLQILYLYPDHLLPILVLVSRERQTGKTTFINWLNMIFGDNMANVSPDDLISGFNAPYAASNLIAVEETMFEKKLTVEKLKALATSKFITVNKKYISQYNLPFFGKIILTSNNEDKFARIDQEEIRFFVRKLAIPSIENHNIEADLVHEIPALLHHLTTLPPVDFAHDRSGFLPSELENESLKLAKEESKSELCQELTMIFEDLFLNELKHLNEFEVDAKSIKEKYYQRNNNIGPYYIRRVLKEELKVQTINEPGYFIPFSTEQGKMGRIRFIIRRNNFTKMPAEVKEETPF